MSQDAYVRIGPLGPMHHGSGDTPTALVFVDLERQEVDTLRQVPHEALRRLETLLVRAEPELKDQPRPPWSPSVADVQAIAERLQLQCDVGLVHQPVGQEPYIEGDVDVDESELLARARAVELDALLAWGQAVWRPRDYHFRLPSGDHAGTFVRLGNAIRQPRDAQVIASWLRRHISNDLGIVCDTGTMAAVVESLRATRLAAGYADGPTSVLERYPATQLAAQQAVRDVLTGEGGRVLALLTVNGSGRAAASLLAALATPGGAVGDDWALEMLVDRRPSKDPKIAVWLPGPGHQPLLGDRQGDDGTCELCRQPATARLVPVNPTSFDGMLPGQVRRLMPDTADAQRNWPLWEVCSRSGGVGLEEKPDDAVSSFRPSPDKMPVHFRLEHLLDHPEYGRNLADALTGELERQRKLEESGRAPWPPEGRLTGRADLVLVARHEFDASLPSDDGSDERNVFAPVFEEVRPLLCADGARAAPFPVTEAWNDELQRLVAGAQDIVVLAMGAVTGKSLTRALVEVQRIKRDSQRPGSGGRVERPKYALRGLVAHARPARRRAWQALENSYNKQLFAVWFSYLPERSPLQDELTVLDELDPSDLSESAIALFERRKAFASGDLAGAADGDEPRGDGWEDGQPSLLPMFWGERPGDRLSPHSLYGERLTGIVTFVAVGAAMERRRQETRERAAPELRVFELDALLVSYFDKLIVAATLRWLRPEEAWWGDSPHDAEATLLKLLDRARGVDDLRIVLPELLLAAAQGKVPSPLTRLVTDKARALLRDATIDARTSAALELALAAVEGSTAQWPVLAAEFDG